MKLDEYLSSHSEAEPEYLAKINRATHVRMINPRMLSGHYQGRVLSMYSHMIKPERVLEIGTFTGYSALCLAEGLAPGGILYTIECDDELESFIQKNIAGSEYADKIKLLIGDALEVMSKLDYTFDLVFIDADKSEYLAYYQAILPKVKNGGYIFVDNTLWDEKVLKPLEPKDKDTKAILEFNSFVAADNRVEKVILPIRDGLTLIRKK